MTKKLSFLARLKSNKDFLFFSDRWFYENREFWNNDAKFEQVKKLDLATIMCLAFGDTDKVPDMPFIADGFPLDGRTRRMVTCDGLRSRLDMSEFYGEPETTTELQTTEPSTTEPATTEPATPKQQKLNQQRMNQLRHQQNDQKKSQSVILTQKRELLIAQTEDLTRSLSSSWRRGFIILTL